MSWFAEYARKAAHHDRLVSTPRHVQLIALGLAGEVGSIVAETKKKARELGSYPLYERALQEELGDALWYVTRLIQLVSPRLIERLDRPRPRKSARTSVEAALGLAAACGACVEAVAMRKTTDASLENVWDALIEVAHANSVPIRDAAGANLEKIANRWPTEEVLPDIPDETYPIYEQFPRKLRVEFREIGRGGRQVMLLRCSGLNIADRLTDNSRSPDYYRYHDVFHFAYAVYCGWSPVTRSNLACKRKSDPRVDEVQDGARAIILEEAVSAIIFSRAIHLDLFEHLKSVDFDLLKTVHEFVRNYEAEDVPLWVWNKAIIEGYRVFRLLKANDGGIVTLDFRGRKLKYSRPAW